MHVHANAAVSVDGKLATRRREQLTLSGPEDFERVDRLRASVDAVVVGVGTVLADDPGLTTPHGDDQPARVVADTHGRIPPDARVLSAAAPTYVLAGDDLKAERHERLEAAGATVIRTGGSGQAALEAGFDALEAEGIGRVLVEGGGEVFYSLFEADLVDELTVFISPRLVGGADAPTLVDGPGFVDRFPSLRLVDTERLDEGLCCRYRPTGWATSAEAINP